MKHTFRCEHNEDSEITLVTHEESLTELLSEFRMYLLGCGYHVPYDLVLDVPLELSDTEKDI